MVIKKSQITIQTFFFILMSIFFVWIIIFGFKQISNVNNQISDQDKVLIEKDLKDGFEYCNDPLNKGSQKIVKIEHKDINGICVLNNINEIPIEYNNYKTQISSVFDGGDNVVLFNGNYINSNSGYIIKELIVTGSFNIDNQSIKNTTCWIDNSHKGFVVINFIC